MKPITLARIKRKIIRTFFREQWMPVICGLDGSRLKTITPPRDRFWADPFVIEDRGKTYVFVEQQIGEGKGCKGTLGVFELFPGMTLSPFVSILEKPYHLSFPNVFRTGNEWYMIPETHENKTIDVYRAADFPYTWRHEMTLVSGIEAVDSVVFEHNEKYYLFTSVGGEGRNCNGNLFLFYADRFPSDAWTPHPRNPVCSDARNSRMAGALFVHDGKIYRPAQDCLKDYGRSTNVNEIIELSPDSYKERIVKTIYPERGLHEVCTHTLNYSDHFMARDVKTRRFFLDTPVFAR
ncbi:MAG: hypothetical protein LBB61_01215 [Treponema sp.]|jgi:hypothetical protein|nr:hypothetical protein [Treponema sp.]